MTYSDYEISPYSSNPTELFHFAGSQDWRYSSSDSDVTYDGETYTAIPIRRGRIQQSNEMPKSEIEIRVPRNNPMIGELVYGLPEQAISLTIYRVQSSFSIVLWKGRLMSRTYDGEEAVLKCVPIFSSLKRPAIRRRYQTNCPYTLYDLRSCRVVKGDFEEAESISDISENGLTLTVPGADFLDWGYLTGGWMSVTALGIERMIYEHIGTTVRLARPVDFDYSVYSAKFYPGCNHTLGQCHDRFDNAANFGGFPVIPNRNPFGSGGLQPNSPNPTVNNR